MNLDALVQAVFNPQTLFICMAVYVITYFGRKVIEGTWKILIANGTFRQTVTLDRLWNEVFLPVFPVLVGGLMGLMAKTFIWPEITNGTRGGRILYGAICGMFSSFVYNRIRAWLKSSPSKGASAAEDDKALLPGASEPPEADGVTIPVIVTVDRDKTSKF